MALQFALRCLNQIGASRKAGLDTAMSYNHQASIVLQLCLLITITGLSLLVGPLPINRAATNNPTARKSGPAIENRDALGTTIDQTDTPSNSDDNIAVRKGNSSGDFEETPLPPKATLVRSVRLYHSKDTIRVVVATNGLAQFEDFILNDPTRVVVDVIGIRNGVQSRSIETGTPSITRVRVGQPRPGVARIALDATGQVTYRVTREGTSLVIAAGPSEHDAAGLDKKKSEPFDRSAEGAAQSVRELRGTVKDQNGALIVNALITLDDHH